MTRKIIFLLVVFLVTESITGQSVKPVHDSCVVTVHFMSLDKLPYPGRMIVCNPDDHKACVQITDSLGKAKFFLPKDTSYTFQAYNGSLLIGNYSFYIPGKSMSRTINFYIQEDFFNEDRTGEVLIDTTWASDRKLVPSPHMIEVEVKLTNDQAVPLPQTIVLFRDSISRNVFIGETNDLGTFNILIPKDRQYGVRIAQMGNRFPVCEFSTAFDTVPSLVRVNMKFNQTVENTYSENLLTTLNHPIRQFHTSEEIPDLFTLNNMYFDFDKSTIQSASFPELNNLVSVLKSFPDICIEIRGHTDNFGEDDYNLALSDRRSASVRNYLIESGISSRRIQCKGYGEKFPVQSNDTDTGRQANRRIEVKVLSRSSVK